MRRLMLLSTALVAVLGSAAALSTLASAALPEILPVAPAERTFTGANEGELRIAISGGSELACTSAVGIGTQEASAPSGSFHNEFKGCTTESGTIKCTGLGEAAGTILVLGTWHLVFDKLGSELLVAILLSPEQVHISCSIVLATMKGTELCLALKPTEVNTTHSDHCIQSGGVASDRTYFNDTGNEVTVKLECSANEAAPKECAELGLPSGTSLEALFADI